MNNELLCIIELLSLLSLLISFEEQGTQFNPSLFSFSTFRSRINSRYGCGNTNILFSNKAFWFFRHDVINLATLSF